MTQLHKYLQSPKNFTYLKANLKGQHQLPAATYVRKANSEFDTIIWPDENPSKLLQTFKPLYTPQRMLREGIFGGLYFGSGKEDTLYPLGLERMKLLPQEWFEGIYMSDTKPSYKLNKFNTSAGLDRTWWLNGNLISDCDPLGWFEWYCHFYLGRRIPVEDVRQMCRWLNYKERHSRMALSNESGVTDRYRQSLYQWAVSPYPDEPSKQ